LAPLDLNTALFVEGAITIPLTRPERPQVSRKKEPSIVVTLDLARAFRHAVDGGTTQIALARRHGLTTARVSQILSLLKLPAETLAYVESLRGQPLGTRYLTERALRTSGSIALSRRLQPPRLANEDQ